MMMMITLIFQKCSILWIQFNLIPVSNWRLCLIKFSTLFIGALRALFTCLFYLFHGAIFAMRGVVELVGCATWGDWPAWSRGYFDDIGVWCRFGGHVGVTCWGFGPALSVLNVHEISALGLHRGVLVSCVLMHLGLIIILIWHYWPILIHRRHRSRMCHQPRAIQVILGVVVIQT